MTDRTGNDHVELTDAESEHKPKAGWDCYGDCGRSIADGITLHRTGPKGEPGDFMCADCIAAIRDAESF